MKTIVAILLVIAGAAGARAQIPVTDVANLVNNEIAQVENMAKWVESIAQLKTQIDQLKQQISIQGDIRRWAGDPAAAGERSLRLGHGRTRAREGMVLAEASPVGKPGRLAGVMGVAVILSMVVAVVVMPLLVFLVKLLLFTMIYVKTQPKTRM